MNIIGELVFVSNQEHMNVIMLHLQVNQLVAGQVLVVLVADKLAFNNFIDSKILSSLTPFELLL